MKIPKACGFCLLLLFGFPIAICAEDVLYERGDRRDPFVPLIGPHATKKIQTVSQRLPIEGIIFDPDKGSYILVGGKVFQEGDMIEEAKLVRILPDRVILLQESKEVTIWLREEIFGENPVSSYNDSQSQDIPSGLA